MNEVSYYVFLSLYKIAVNEYISEEQKEEES